MPELIAEVVRPTHIHSRWPEAGSACILKPGGVYFLGWEKVGPVSSMGALLRWALPGLHLSEGWRPGEVTVQSHNPVASSTAALEVTKLLLSLLDQQSAWVLPERPWEQVESLLLWGEKTGKFYKQQSHLITTELGNDTQRLLSHHQLCLCKPAHNRQHVWLPPFRAREKQQHLQSSVDSACELWQHAELWIAYFWGAVSHGKGSGACRGVQS